MEGKQKDSDTSLPLVSSSDNGWIIERKTIFYHLYLMSDWKSTNLGKNYLSKRSFQKIAQPHGICFFVKERSPWIEHFSGYVIPLLHQSRYQLQWMSLFMFADGGERKNLVILKSIDIKQTWISLTISESFIQSDTRFWASCWKIVAYHFPHQTLTMIYSSYQWDIFCEQNILMYITGELCRINIT